jgi:hypothetical protein
MPQTTLAGATIFSQRLLDIAERELNVCVFGGIVEVQVSDTPEKLLSRADSALYSARSNGQSCLYQHTGKEIRLHEGIRPHEVKATCDFASPLLDENIDEMREPTEMLR